MHLFPVQIKKTNWRLHKGGKFSKASKLYKQSNLKNIAQYQVKIISNHTWNLLAISTKPTCQITDCCIVKKWYILQRKKIHFQINKKVWERDNENETD